MAVTPQTNASLEDIARLMAELDDFVICGHENPDGDCIGSMLALRHMLESMGKRVTCTRASTLPLDPTLNWLPGAGDIKPAAHVAKHHAAFVGVDVPSRDRLAPDACKLLDGAKVSFTIDHHANDTTMCQHVFVDPDAASCTLLIWELAKLFGKPIPYETALCCYTGLVTDTGGFCYQNTDSRAFDHAGEMIAQGIDPSLVSRNVFQNRSIASLKLESLCVSRMSFSDDGLAVLSWITEDDMEELGATKADAEPLVDTLRSVRGIEVACMLREQNGVVRGSLRAKKDIDVSKLARSYGGGGHVAASGFTLETDMEHAREIVARDIAELVKHVVSV